MNRASPRQQFLAYLAALLCFLLMDACWLSLTSGPLYKPAFGALMAPEPNWLPVALFYPLYLFGLLVFAIRPALEQRESVVALRRGALLGLMAYAAYDLTNQATLRDWPWSITVIDMAWGTTVSACAAWAGAWLTSRRARRTSAR
jgi:uncharacterized membrane protein